MHVFLDLRGGVRLALCTFLYYYQRTHHFSSLLTSIHALFRRAFLIGFFPYHLAAGGIGVGISYATPQSNARLYVILDFPRREPHLSGPQ
jgi:hypothetical protein